MRRQPSSDPSVVRATCGAFSLPDLLVVAAVLSLLAMVIVPVTVRTRAKSRLNQCLANVKEIDRAVTLYAGDHQGILPHMTNAPAPGAWWHYRDQVKSYLGLSGAASPSDRVLRVAGRRSPRAIWWRYSPG